MVLDRTSRPVWRWSDEDRCVRCRRVVGVQEDGGIPFGQPGFKGDYPCEAAGLGDEEGDEDDVFHIGCLVGGKVHMRGT